MHTKAKDWTFWYFMHSFSIQTSDAWWQSLQFIGRRSLPCVTLPPLISAPSPPLEPSAVAHTSDKINVSWKAPEFPHGVVLSYLVIYSSVKHLPLSQWSSTAVKGMTVTIQALSRDTQYWIRVAARTSAGQGNYSSPTSTRTPKYDCQFSKCIHLIL